MEGELAKENIQPLSKDCANKSVSVSNSVSNGNYDCERRSLLESIRNYNGDDPLAPWLRYIKEAIAQSTSGSKAELFGVLKECANTFLGREEYQDDIRYLRIWIQYADLSDEPRKVFAFLEESRIGLSHSLLYEGYAAVLERKHDFKQANEIYSRGFKRAAEPQDRLKVRYRDFQTRMQKRMLRKQLQKEERAKAMIGNQGTSHISGIDARMPTSQMPGDTAALCEGQIQGQSEGVEGAAGSISPSRRAREGSPAFLGDGAGATVTEQHAAVARDNEGQHVTLGPHKENVPVLSDWEGVQAGKRPRRDSDSGSEASIDIFVDEELRSPSAGRRLRRGVGSGGARRRGLQARVEPATPSGEARAEADAAALPAVEPESSEASHSMATHSMASHSMATQSMAHHGMAHNSMDTRRQSSEATSAAPSEHGLGRVDHGDQETSFEEQRWAWWLQERGLPLPPCMQATQLMSEPPAITTQIPEPGRLSGSGCSTPAAASAASAVSGAVAASAAASGGAAAASGDEESEEVSHGLSGLGLGEERVKGLREMVLGRRRRGNRSAAAAAAAGRRNAYAAGGASGAAADAGDDSGDDNMEGGDLLSFDTSDIVSDDVTMACKSISRPSKVTTFPSGPPRQLNPWSSTLKGTLIYNLQPPLHTCPGYQRHSEPFDMPAKLKALKGKAGKAVELRLGSRSYQIEKLLGKGAYARVFSAVETSAVGSEAAEDATVVFKSVALKVQTTPCPWEFYIYRQIQMRIDGPQRRLFGMAFAFHEFPNASILTCSLGTSGTLQDVVNAFKHQGKPVPELLCAFYTAHMLRVVEALHATHILHGDVKPDNFLLRFGSDSKKREDMVAALEAGDASTGLSLVDYGRSIDLRLFPEGSSFLADGGTENFRCLEMQEGRPWTTQADLFAVCATAYCLLHGQYMEVVRVDARERRGRNGATNCDAEDDVHGVSGGSRTARYCRPVLPLKRYWNGELWQELFDTYLNIAMGQPVPPPARVRRLFERYVADHAKDVAVQLLDLRDRVET